MVQWGGLLGDRKGCGGLQRDSEGSVVRMTVGLS